MPVFLWFPKQSHFSAQFPHLALHMQDLPGIWFDPANMHWKEVQKFPVHSIFQDTNL